MTHLTIARLLFGSFFLLGLTFVASTSFANEESFRIAGDGSVVVDEETFVDTRSYVESELFRARNGRCGFDRASQTRSAEFRASRTSADCSNLLTVIKQEYEPTLLMEIPVWFHVIQQTNGVGFISDAQIADQMTVLNEDFQAIMGSLGELGYDAKLKFTLVGITRTTNDAWYTDSTADESAYKTALAKDPSQFLNIYTNDASGNLGYAYLPDGSAGQFYDGVVMLSDSIGGRDNGFSVYNQGRTLVHEVGHYLGLMHTFSGGTACSNTFSSGDLVVDTNAESVPYYGSEFSCDSRSTCETVDPVDNYMDYNTDSCMSRFTAQQVNRMICSTINYRAGLITVDTDNEEENVDTDNEEENSDLCIPIKAGNGNISVICI
jgi:hypothetical protein